MRKVTAIVITVLAVVAVLSVVFIARSEAASTLGASSEAALVVPPPSKTSADAPALTGLIAPASYGDEDEGQMGIWVSGEGAMSVEPDLATLDFGVETTALSVSDANNRASTTMDKIVKALKARGVKDKDMQTSRFSIYPLYDYVEEVVDGVRSGRQVLTGYRVNNTATVKLRDLDSIGEVIDEVVAAGGGDARIGNINFTLEDPKPKMAKLREMAVKDAKTKAEHLAKLSGVSAGRLIYISEGAAAPSVRGFSERSFDYAYPAAAPSISGGELSLSLSVQAGFAIY